MRPPNNEAAVIAAEETTERRLNRSLGKALSINVIYRLLARPA